ncbi:MAG: CoA transferase [Deltaproteobacteria bacterium]|nr:CoA transferase [Deltaproteobacteria bacterium]
MAGPLDGVKVLDFTQVYSGSFCTLLLRDLGAEVIKIERTQGGDTVRNDAPHTEGWESGTFIILNRGKKGITLNLQSEKGREIVKRMVKDVDIVVENFSYGTMDKLGLGYDELSKLNPQLVYASITGYGHTGPRRDEPGYDPVIQATAGMISINGFPDRPVKCSVAIADFSSGIFTALAIVAAYVHSTKTGEGQQIDISLQDCLWLLNSIEFSPPYFLKGITPPRVGNGHPMMTPGNLYPASDGYVTIATGNLGQVQRLFRMIGGDELVNSPMCSQQSERIKYKEQIDALVGEWTGKMTRQEIASKLKSIDIACGVVAQFNEVCEDPHLKSRGMITEVEQTISGKVRVPGSLFKLSKTPGNINFPAPFHGEHNHDVYTGMLGYTDQEIDELVNEGII